VRRPARSKTAPSAASASIAGVFTLWVRRQVIGAQRSMEMTMIGPLTGADAQCTPAADRSETVPRPRESE
jgi:hypothetical protein